MPFGVPIMSKDATSGALDWSQPKVLLLLFWTLLLGLVLYTIFLVSLGFELPVYWKALILLIHVADVILVPLRLVYLYLEAGYIIFRTIPSGPPLISPESEMIGERLLVVHGKLPSNVTVKPVPSKALAVILLVLAGKVMVGMTSVLSLVLIKSVEFVGLVKVAV